MAKNKTQLPGDEMTTTRKNICQPADWWLGWQGEGPGQGMLF
jgi:hypothetical protein